MKWLTLASMIVFAVFLTLGFRKWEIRGSYSAYARLWGDTYGTEISLWSIITFLTGLLLLPAMIEVGEGSYCQFMGFFAPLYLIIVSFTPDWETKRAQGIVHRVGAILCATLSFLWLILIMKVFMPIVLSVIIVGVIAFSSRRVDAYVLWGEMIMFIAVYATLLLK